MRAYRQLTQLDHVRPRAGVRTRLEPGLAEMGLDDETCPPGAHTNEGEAGGPGDWRLPAYLVEDEDGDALLVGHALELARDAQQRARPLSQGLRGGSYIVGERPLATWRLQGAHCGVVVAPAERGCDGVDGDCRGRPCGEFVPQLVHLQAQGQRRETRREQATHHEVLQLLCIAALGDAQACHDVVGPVALHNASGR